MKRRKRRDSAAPEGAVVGYNYATAEDREATVPALLQKARVYRAPVEQEWEKWNDYYNFIHDATEEMREFCEEREIPWVPATLPDCYIQVESQITPTVPEPEFRGRDDDLDSVKAKERELAVRYVIENNRLEDLNNANERRLIKLGDAFWKVYWDGEMRCGMNEGDIRVNDVPVEDIYVDPSCRNNGIQAGQYVGYTYSLHRVRFAQLYRRELKKLGLTVEDIAGGGYLDGHRLFDLTLATDSTDDTIQVLEWWYRVPESYYDTELGMEVPAGAVACSIQAGGREIRHIPLYWRNTFRQCSLFPFVHYWRIRDENGFYNKSELFPIKDLVDAGDRKLGSTLLNDAFMSNDVILVEEGAMAPGEKFVNAPGAVNTVRPNKSGAVSRLGGLHSAADSSLTNFLMEQIQRTNRNYDTNMGKETSRQTTATGLAMLRDDADSQGDIKSSDRDRGFERLYELIDWHCLEFFDDDRLLFIGAKTENDEPKTLMYNAANFSRSMAEVYDPETRELLRPAWNYWPRVDVTVTAGDGVVRGKQATLQALDKLVAMNVTAENYKLLLAELDILDIPQKKEIEEDWKARFEPAVPQEVIDALARDPNLLRLVEGTLALKNGQEGGMGNEMSQMRPGDAAGIGAGEL